MLNVTFLVPPVIVGEHPAERSSGCTRVVYPTPNIYELQVAACVEQKHQVAYLDCVNHAISVEDLLKRVAEQPADIYCMWTVNLSVQNDIEMTRRIHQTAPDAWVILLGPGASYFYKDCHVDERTIVVHGEPEITLMELLDKLDQSEPWQTIDGISYIADGQHHRNAMRPLMKDLDGLPFPARHLVSDITYRNPKLKCTPYTTMVTSRNCPFRCIYCVPSSLTFAREIEYKEYNHRKPPISFRSTDKVAEEIRQLAREGIKAIGFMDDNFIWNEQRTAAICDVLRETGIVWGCQARVDAITEPIAQMLGSSGCQYVDLGVESFNDEILAYIHKGITSEQIYTAIRLLQQYKVPVKLNILIGTSPLETKQTIRDTIRKAKALHVDQLMINIVSPFPGTQFYKMALDNGWIKDGVYTPTDVQRESILNYPQLSNKEMEKLLFESNISYFLSPRFVWKQMRKFRSFSDFTHALKSLKIKLFG